MYMCKRRNQTKILKIVSHFFPSFLSVFALFQYIFPIIRIFSKYKEGG